MIDEKEFKKLEDLSALSFSKEERDKMLHKLNETIEFIDQIKNFSVNNDSEDVQRSISVEDLRDDIVKPSMPVDELLFNAPEKENGAFLVPKVVD